MGHLESTRILKKDCLRQQVFVRPNTMYHRLGTRFFKISKVDNPVMYTSRVRGLLFGTQWSLKFEYNNFSRLDQFNLIGLNLFSVSVGSTLGPEIVKVHFNDRDARDREFFLISEKLRIRNTRLEAETAALDEKIMSEQPLGPDYSPGPHPHWSERQ